MITEDYVSFEVAKLLQEKGFKEPCITYWFHMIGAEPIFNEDMPRQIYNNKSDTIEIIGCPTLQMAMKWMRIEHNIHIEPHIVRTKCSYGYMPNYINLKELKPHFPFDEFDFANADKYVCLTPDKACEATLKYCLEHLI